MALLAGTSRRDGTGNVRSDNKGMTRCKNQTITIKL